jgi:hypothetical protein
VRQRRGSGFDSQGLDIFIRRKKNFLKLTGNETSQPCARYFKSREITARNWCGRGNQQGQFFNCPRVQQVKEIEGPG